MIYDYVNTKPPLEEVYIEHGWLKDQVAKAHKYIERWRGKNGKWYYRYKSKAQELGAKTKRTMKGYQSDEVSDFRKGYIFNSPDFKKVLSSRKDWNKKGVKKSYKKRKTQIETARNNANLVYRKNPKAQYKVRSSKVKQARQNANDAYKNRLSELSKSAKKIHNDRQTQINVARGNAHEAYGKKILGIIGYDKARYGKAKESGSVLKTIYSRGNTWYTDTPQIKTKKKKKK